MHGWELFPFCHSLASPRETLCRFLTSCHRTLICSMLSPNEGGNTPSELEGATERTSDPNTQFHTWENRGPERLGNLPRLAQLISNRTEIRSGTGFFIFLSPDEDEEKWYLWHIYWFPDTGLGDQHLYYFVKSSLEPWVKFNHFTNETVEAQKG